MGVGEEGRQQGLLNIEQLNKKIKKKIKNKKTPKE